MINITSLTILSASLPHSQTDGFRFGSITTIRHALHGAQQALCNVLEADTWHPASQTFYRIDNRPSEIVSFLTH